MWELCSGIGCDRVYINKSKETTIEKDNKVKGKQ